MVALYVKFALVVPAQTDGFAPNVIVGIELIVTVPAGLTVRVDAAELLHPLGSV